MYIGKNLKRIRTEKGLTQKELGELCGWADSVIRKYENGYTNPKFEAVIKIANALNVKIGDLVDELIGEDYKPPTELPADIEKLLDRYRELYDEEQHYNEEHYNYPFKQLSNEVLLMIALDEAIANIHIKRAERRKHGER